VRRQAAVYQFAKSHLQEMRTRRAQQTNKQEEFMTHAIKATTMKVARK